MRLRAERPRYRAQIPALSVANVGRVAVAVVRLQIAFTSEPLRPRIKSNLSEASGIVYSHHQAGAYRNALVLPGHAVIVGLALGPVMILGSFLGKKIVDRLPERIFVTIIEAVLVVAGLLFIVRG